MPADDFLKQKILQLEEELNQKNQELGRYRTELARANAELEKIIANMGQELRLAGLVQKLLSPTEIPNIPGMEFSSKFVPGHKMGGDYFDIFELEDKMRFGILMASSTGYTMSALFLSVLIKLTSTIEARKGKDPDQALAALAKELVPNIQNDDISNVFYALVDRRTYEMKCCSVGNNPMAFLLPQGQDKVTRIEPSVGPLSKNFDQTPLAQTIQLGARDRLVLVSTGILTAENADGQKFGMDRLSKAILKTARSGVHEVRNEVLFQLEQFTGKTEPDRDFTAIVCEVKDRVIKLAKK